MQKKNNKLPNFIDTNGVIVTKRREICTKFNEYFVNVARKLNIDKYNNLQSCLIFMRTIARKRLVLFY